MADSFQGFKASVVRTHTSSLWSYACAEHENYALENCDKSSQGTSTPGPRQARTSVLLCLPVGSAGGHLQMLQCWVASQVSWLEDRKVGLLSRMNWALQAPEQGGTWQPDSGTTQQVLSGD